MQDFLSDPFIAGTMGGIVGGLLVFVLTLPVLWVFNNAVNRCQLFDSLKAEYVSLLGELANDMSRAPYHKTYNVDVSKILSPVVQKSAVFGFKSLNDSLTDIANTLVTDLNTIFGHPFNGECKDKASVMLVKAQIAALALTVNYMELIRKNVKNSL